MAQNTGQRPLHIEVTPDAVTGKPAFVSASKIAVNVVPLTWHESVQTLGQTFAIHDKLLVRHSATGIKFVVGVVTCAIQGENTPRTATPTSKEKLMELISARDTSSFGDGDVEGTMNKKQYYRTGPLCAI